MSQNNNNTNQQSQSCTTDYVVADIEKKNVKESMEPKRSAEEQAEWDRAIAAGAAEMNPDMKALHDLDKKYELDAEIHNVKDEKKVPFDVAVERGAAQVQSSVKIEAKKEDVFGSIDEGAEKLKQGVETIADSTKTSAVQAQENVALAKDIVRENVDWAKEKIQTNVELLKEKTQEVVQRVQEGVQVMGERIGVTQPSGDFNREIASGATAMKASVDMQTLGEIDRRHQLDAEVKTVHKVPFDTEIERAAAEKHTAYVIESKREDAHGAIDTATEMLKEGIEVAAHKSVRVAHQAQDTLNKTVDFVQENVDALKDKVGYGSELAKEKAMENINWTKAVAEESKDAIVGAISGVVQKAQEGVQVVQEGAQSLGEKIGVVPMRDGNFDQSIKKGAVEMQTKLDMNELHELDAKHQLDAKIETNYHVGFDTSIERGAAKMQTGQKIEAARENVLGAIDVGAAKLKEAVEAIADSTKAFAFSTHDTVNSATDTAKMNVDLAKDVAKMNVNVAKEKARENIEWAKANTLEAKDKLVETVQQTQGTVQETVHEAVNNLGETIRSIPEGTYGVKGDFNKSIAVGAVEMKVTRDMDKLHDLDAKYELDADIKTVHKKDIHTEIERAAAKTHATHQIQSTKENIIGAIDKAAENLKHGVDVTAVNAKTVTHNAQHGVYSAQDKAHEGIDLAKEKAHTNYEVAKEIARENVDYTKAHLDQGKEKLVETAQSVKGSLVGGTFDADIAKGAREMHVDTETLKEIDARHQMDAKISTVHKTDFKTELEREANKSKVSRTIEGAKEDVKSKIDAAAATLKEGVEAVSDKSKSVAHDAQQKKFEVEDSIDRTKVTSN